MSYQSKRRRAKNNDETYSWQRQRRISTARLSAEAQNSILSVSVVFFFFLLRFKVIAFETYSVGCNKFPRLLLMNAKDLDGI